MLFLILYNSSNIVITSYYKRGLLMKDKTGRYIIAAGLWIAWSICFATKYLVPAILVTGRNYSGTIETYAYFISKTAATPLSIASWLLLAAALAALVWALTGTYRKDHNKI